MTAHSANSAIATIPPAQPHKIIDEIIIGKDVLELVTGAMYVDPLTIYREYVQNSADAIDEARLKGLYNDSVLPRIDISLDHTTRTVRIRDNATGIPASDFNARLSAIGGSQKRGKGQRGFRGVGRLAGLAYAQEVVFRSRSQGDTTVQEMRWDGRKLRDALRDPSVQGDLTATIRQVAEVSTYDGADWPDHFFEAELRRVVRVRNDLLLNPEEIRAYLSQVAPVPFAPCFSYGSQLHEYLQNSGINCGLPIYLGDAERPIQRPLRNRIKINENISDDFSEVELIEIPGIEGAPAAVGWILHHAYFGALPKASGISGLRVRSGNIQVGNAAIFEALFSEPRFNSWCVGELHILSDRIIPNGRRDDFEVNAHYQNLTAHVANIAARLSKRCREKSILRNRLREAQALFQDASNRLAVAMDPNALPLVRQYYHNSVTATVSKLEKLAEAEGKFSDQERALINEQLRQLRQLQHGRKMRKGRQHVSFLPKTKQKVFLQLLELVLESCESPQQAATLTKRIIDRAKLAQRRQ